LPSLFFLLVYDKPSHTITDGNRTQSHDLERGPRRFCTLLPQRRWYWAR